VPGGSHTSDGEVSQDRTCSCRRGSANVPRDSHMGLRLRLKGFAGSPVRFVDVCAHPTKPS
jgi:hypothetical protein